MKVVVRNNLSDLLAFGRHLKIRKSRFKQSSAAVKPEGRMNILAGQLHPLVQAVRVDSVIDETHDVKTFRLVPCADQPPLAFFRAGQYVALSFAIDGHHISRPYSISSTPAEALEKGFYDVTIKKKTMEQGGFFSQQAFAVWRPGFTLTCSGPMGSFYYEPLRDSRVIVGIAGGSGITPFRSLLSEELRSRTDLRCFLFYGMNTLADFVFRRDLLQLEADYPGRLNIVPVPYQSESDCTDTGKLITRSLIIHTVGADLLEQASVFLCGPEGLHRHIQSELPEKSAVRKLFRCENYGRGIQMDKKTARQYKLTLRQRDTEVVFSCSSNETLLCALERAGVNPPSACRSGECGWCRSQLLSGEVAVDDALTGLRKGDEKFHWIHPCVCYPKSDIVLRVPVNPVQ